MSTIDEVHFCSHCGNTGILKFVASIETPYKRGVGNVGNSLFDSLIDSTMWLLFQCPVCQNPILISEYTSAGRPMKSAETTYEFPKMHMHFEGVPDKIRSAFESAVKTKGIDRAICILSLRRTLEMICKDKGAKGNDLRDRIKDLIDKKVLPEMMSDACWIVRQSGNDAAHADDVTFTEHEVREIIEYVSTVIDYLYSMPVRISELKQRIERRKSKS